MDPFSTVPVGRTSLRITRLGLGTAAISDPGVSDRDAEDTIRAAWDAGVRHFDTAPMYGQGLAEIRLGRVLADYPRDEYVLSTKVGRLVTGHEDGDGVGEEWHFDFSADGVRRSVAASARRLGIDRFDILLIHDADDHADQAIGEAFPALAALREQGAVRAVGFGMTQIPVPLRAVRETDMDVLLLAGRYSLLDPEGAVELLPACVERGVSVMNAQSLHGGLIAGQPDPRFHYQPVDPATQARLDVIRDVCDRHGVPTAAAAIQFPVAHPAVASVVTGPATGDQARGNLAWAQIRIPGEVWDALRAEGILGADIPTPAGDPSPVAGEPTGEGTAR